MKAPESLEVLPCEKGGALHGVVVTVKRSTANGINVNFTAKQSFRRLFSKGSVHTQYIFEVQRIVVSALMVSAFDVLVLNKHCHCLKHSLICTYRE